MKRWMILITALLFVSCETPLRSAHAEWTTTMPPAEYDVPYTGELTIWRVQSQQGIRQHCWRATFTEHAIACTVHSRPYPSAWCDVYVLEDAILKKVGLTLAAVLRHELAHCNGWPGDHSGGTSVRSTTVSMPKLPSWTQWLPASPGICIMPGRIFKPCEDVRKLGQ